MTTVDFIFDFGSPNAYLCHKAIPRVEERAGISFNYIPCLLGGIFKATGNQSPFTAFAGIKNKSEYDRLEMYRFIQKYRIPFQMNPFFPVNTLHIMRGAIAADLDGKLETYVDGIFHFMWEEPRKLDDAAVLEMTFSDIGFDPAKLLQRMGEDEVKQKLIANTNMAVERGAFGAPTFFIGNEMWFGKERLRDIEDYVRELA